MIEDSKIENSSSRSGNDPKAMMLAALAKKQKNNNMGKPSGPTSGSKIGAGQATVSAPKMYRRKAGSA